MSAALYLIIENNPKIESSLGKIASERKGNNLEFSSDVFLNHNKKFAKKEIHGYAGEGKATMDYHMHVTGKPQGHGFSCSINENKISFRVACHRSLLHGADTLYDLTRWLKKIKGVKFIDAGIAGGAMGNFDYRYEANKWILTSKIGYELPKEIVIK